jgi:hypothetical protein
MRVEKYAMDEPPPAHTHRLLETHITHSMIAHHAAEMWMEPGEHKEHKCALPW